MATAIPCSTGSPAPAPSAAPLSISARTCPALGSIRPRNLATQQRHQRIELAQSDIELKVARFQAGELKPVGLEHQVQIAAIGIAAHVKLQAADGELASAQINDIQVKAIQS